MEIFYKGDSLGGGGGGSFSDVYSEEETQIGTWIDGKPLYRRVFKATLPKSNGDNQTLVVPDVVFDYLVRLTAFIRVVEDVVSIVPVPFHNRDHDFSIDYATGKFGVRISVNTSYTPILGSLVYVIAEYTKTTDAS